MSLQTMPHLLTTFLPLLAAFFLLGAMAPPALGQARPQPGRSPAATPSDESRVEVARLGLAEGPVEVQRTGGPWGPATADLALAIGDRVRTLKGGSARLDFPWTAIAMSDTSEVALEKNRVLTLKLERGRLDMDPEQTLLRVVTDEAVLSGSGRTLVRREGGVTFVGSNNGGAVVEAQGKVVRLGVNGSTTVKTNAAPTDPIAMKPPPRVVSPASDPRYVRPGQAVRLVWTGDDPVYHLAILSIDSDVPFMSIDVEATEHELQLPWLGTFRWRVSGRKGAVETQPSGEGLICVVEK